MNFLIGQSYIFVATCFSKLENSNFRKEMLTYNPARMRPDSDLLNEVAILGCSNYPL